MDNSEKQRVIRHSLTANYAEGVNKKTTAYCGEIFKRYMCNNGSVLELGPAEGIMTDILYPYFSDYTVVDGADFFVEAITRKHPKIKGYACLFEKFEPVQKYDNIILGHVLEHVISPVKILQLASSWLKGGGGY